MDIILYNNSAEKIILEKLKKDVESGRIPLEKLPVLIQHLLNT